MNFWFLILSITIGAGIGIAVGNVLKTNSLSPSWWFANLIVGVIGGVLGGWLFTLLPDSDQLGLLGTGAGACIIGLTLVFIVNMIVRRGSGASP